jgi:DNA-binding CsgD family transcriptional regulator
VVVDRLLEGARQGLGGALVISGEAGIGKTALLDYAVAAAKGLGLVRFTGIEAERELSYAALQRLLTPVLHEIERLPPPQRAAINSALGLAAGPPPDRFLVGLGTISLAATAARAGKRLLYVIDDAQWVDCESLDALAFWGRRIGADGIALVFAVRGSESTNLLPGLDIIELHGLTDDAALALLTSVAAVGVDPEVVSRLVAETGGNPLALIELTRDLTAAQLQAAVAMPQPLPLGRRLEEHFIRQVRSLPQDAQQLLLLVAADSSGDTALIAHAASHLGISLRAAEPAEAEGLLVLGAEVRFRHPLIRSAVYGGARSSDRRAVHRALADATDGDAEPERRAWHLAAALIGPDQEVATLLEWCADRARRRGGYSAQAALLLRAAELTPDPHHAAANRVGAAAAALAANAPRQALTLIERAAPDLLDEHERAKAKRLEGTAWALMARSRTAAPILLSAGLALLEFDRAVGRRTLLEALEAAFLAGNLDDDMRDISRRAATASVSSPGEDTEVDLLLDALSHYVTVGFAGAAPELRAAVEAMRRHKMSDDALSRWSLILNGFTRALWDQEAHDELVTHVADVSRKRGELGLLVVALQSCATAETWAGQFSAADAYLAQADDLASAAADSLNAKFMGLDVRGRQGRESETRAKAAIVISAAARLGLGTAAVHAHLALLVLDLGMGRYEDGLAHARFVFDADPVMLGNDVLGDMAEAAVRADDLDTAGAAVRRLAERAPASGTPWALGLLARSRALLAGDGAEPLYREALSQFESTRLAFELARTRLLYGEWLRRQKRRIDAREQLRVAYEMLDTMGSEAFAKRARDELLATGERARKRSVETSNQLTPQEEHIARLAAGGDSNSEIAAQLFISTNTVEYHLRKVFRKLGVTSRRKLGRALPPTSSSPDR